MKGIEIIGLGKALPKLRVKNDDLKQYIDTSDEWIKSRTGIEARFFCKDQESLTDLGVLAARRAIKDAGIHPDQIGLVIFATCTTDYMVPSMACAVQELVGIPGGIPAFDINAACSGFVYGLQLVNALMKEGNACMGQKPYALLIGGEQLSKMLDFSERSVSVLFGDGAAAAVIHRSEEKAFYSHTAAKGDRSALYAHTVGRNQLPPMDSKGDRLVPSNPLQISKEGSDRILREGFLQMDGRKVFRFAVRALSDEIQEMELQSGILAKDIDYIVCHQANVRIIDYVRKKMGLPKEKFFLNLPSYGNTSGASIPLALSDMKEEGLLKPGTKIFCVGFGAGLTWGGCFLEF